MNLFLYGGVEFMGTVGWELSAGNCWLEESWACSGGL
jgi:hypothetical protein